MKILQTILLTILTATVFGQIRQKKNPTDFLPKGYVIFEKINGDLNNDGIVDCVLVIKGTDKNYFVSDKYRGQLDRNRRGIIILFNKNDYYELALKNYDCFSSENENGGVYFAPELSIEIKKGNLYAHYGHGRYGYWKYTFRFKNSDFELIGYDQSNNRGPLIESETSINFLNKKKQEKVNTNENAEGDDEVFKETWKNITINKLIKLSEIKDFDDLDMSVF
jgi:tRNA nucleotidyltransferase (CCA-adding enzyme)